MREVGLESCQDEVVIGDCSQVYLALSSDVVYDMAGPLWIWPRGRPAERGGHLGPADLAPLHRANTDTGQQRLISGLITPIVYFVILLVEPVFMLGAGG